MILAKKQADQYNLISNQHNYYKQEEQIMIKKGYEIQLNVRPIYVGLQHKYFFEGPCRMDKSENLTPEADAIINAQFSQGFFKLAKNRLENEKGINLMEPIYAERDCYFLTKEEFFDEVMKDHDKVDLFLVGCHIARGDLIVELAQRTGKPILIGPETPGSTTRYVSAMRARGYEAYGAFSWEDGIKRMHALRLRKVIAHTHILQAVRHDSTSEITNNSFISPNEVTLKLGTKFRGISLHELLDQSVPGDSMNNHCTPGRKGENPTEEDMKEIRRITDELCAGACEVGMEKDKVEKSVRMWYTVQKFLDLYDCNAFVMPCPDFCATCRAMKENQTPCFTHSLNNELGIPSSCEFDPIATLSMQLLESASGCAAYMGEVNPIEYSSITDAGEALDKIKDHSNLMTIFHSVGNRKMHGFDKPNSEYGIEPFAYSGWGATMRYDFSQDVGQEITMCRFSPDCKKLFIAKGVVEGGARYLDKNCSLTMVFRVKDSKDYYYKQLNFGSHIPLTYGDYTEELKMFAESVGLEPIMA